MKKHHGKSSRNIPENWAGLHSEDCGGACDALDGDQYDHEFCPVWYQRHGWGNDGWRGAPVPMTIEWDKGFGSFYDRYGQVCHIGFDDQILNFGLDWALNAPDQQPPWPDDMYRNKDWMILDKETAAPVLQGLKTFFETGYVPALERTGRGFGTGTFQDALGQGCSLQDSSLATEAACWFGVDTNCEGVHVNMRAHLTRDMVMALIPVFEQFLGSNSIPTAQLLP